MNKEHAIADEVLELVTLAVSKGEHWMAYNNSLYFIDKEDVHFFKTQTAANEFARDNISDYDSFQVLHVSGIDDLLRNIPYGQKLEQDISNGLNGNNQSINYSSKTIIMNEQNFQYLKDNIKYMGFGENMSEALEANLKQGKPEFTISNKAEINKKPFEVSLNFRKSDSSDMYFFNSYHASLTRLNGVKVDQTFYLNKGKGITAKEAYNMLEGRSVYKELSTKDGQSYKAWVQLDFENKDKHNNHEVKQFHENYGFDLKAAVSKFAIAELADADKEKSLMQSLQKGNIQSVSIERDGSIAKMFIEANPQFKTVTLYDTQMKRMQKEELAQYQSVQQSPGKDMKQEQKEELKPDKKKDIKQTTSSDLSGPKKRAPVKKGCLFDQYPIRAG